MDKSVHSIYQDNRLIAQIYDTRVADEDVFPTPYEAEMQCGFGLSSVAKSVAPHLHKQITRENQQTSEFLFVIEGTMKARIYNDDGNILYEITLRSGMALLQLAGGHGFDIEANTRYIEVKQGPYLGHENDKIML